MFIYLWGLILGLLCLSPRAIALEQNPSSNQTKQAQIKEEFGRPSVLMTFIGSQLPDGTFVDCLTVVGRVQEDGSFRVLAKASTPVSARTGVMQESFDSDAFIQTPTDMIQQIDLGITGEQAKLPIVFGRCRSDNPNIPDHKFTYAVPMARTYVFIATYVKETNTWKKQALDVNSLTRSEAFADKEVLKPNSVKKGLQIHVQDDRPKALQITDPINSCSIYSAFIRDDDLTKVQIWSESQLNPHESRPGVWTGVLEPAQLNPSTAGFLRTLPIPVTRTEPVMSGSNALVTCNFDGDQQTWMPARLGGNYRERELFETGVFTWQCHIQDKGPHRRYLFCNRYNAQEETLLTNWWDPNTSPPNTP